ncbi:hypothetical protein B0T14DRAFT_305627 [Immersiella caudata]|uniref:Uncharacterized protein n=1 Tax=Immersiella caudata TaxID=314043 RepID=A0AA39WF46_9PEZI|nr:hypothetical protein B0T14DRAFT_305627 [Immersiella caudata]
MLARTLITGWLLASAVAQYAPFVPAETGAILSPRFYRATPAKPLPLRKRQAQCLEGNHACDELGEIGNTACCPNDSYCIVNATATTKAACCPLGSTCDSQCNEQQYLCPATVTRTEGGSTITTVAPACCGRVCSRTSMFRCAESLGGACCSYGSVCGANVCISTVSASTSSKPIVTQVPEGCTTSQITCAASIGGGCCAVTQTCTLVSGSARCAEAVITPTGSGVSLAEERPNLTVGAKAGISVGVVVGCGLLIGLATWWCLRRRKERSELSSQQPRPTGVIGHVLGGGRDPTDTASEMVSHGVPNHGIAQDYFGPDPVVGPYTEYHNESGISTPRVGVPLQPHGPGDIAAPVEIDSRTPELKPQGQLAASVGNRTPGDRTPNLQPQAGDGIYGRYELHGSEYLDPNAVIPSPITPTVPSPPEGP